MLVNQRVYYLYTTNPIVNQPSHQAIASFGAPRFQLGKPHSFKAICQKGKGTGVVGESLEGNHLMATMATVTIPQIPEGKSGKTSETYDGNPLECSLGKTQHVKHVSRILAGFRGFRTGFGQWTDKKVLFEWTKFFGEKKQRRNVGASKVLNQQAISRVMTRRVRDIIPIDHDPHGETPRVETNSMQLLVMNHLR